MLDHHAKASQGRLLSPIAGTALLAAAVALSGASQALAQSSTCPVTFAVSNATQIEALQFESTMTPGAAAQGDFSACDASTSGILDFNTDGNTLEVGWAADSGPFTGPGDFVTCNFTAPGGVPTIAPSDFSSIATLDCTKQTIPSLQLCSPAPTYSVTIGTCSVCGNGTVEPGEQCETTDPRCNPSTCQLNGTCSDQPLVGCKTGATGKSKLQFKDKLAGFADNTKDAGQYAFGAGAATDLLTDFGADPALTPGLAYKLCVYDGTGLVADHEVASQGTCAGKDCWKGGTKKYGFKDKDAASDGVSQITLQPGAAGKTKVQVKLKSKLGNFAAPPLPLTEPGVVAQFVSPTGVCFETAFPAGAKNDSTQYSAKGP